MTERAFYQTLRRNLSPKGFDLQRIETTAGRGVPDVNFCYRGTEGWLELKKFSRKRRTGTFKVPHLRDAQCAWIQRRVNAGGRAFLLCQVDHDLLLVPGEFIYPVFKGELSWDNPLNFCRCYLSPPINYELLICGLCRR